MQNFITQIKETQFPLNEKGELKQNSRNAFRADVITQIAQLLQESGLSIGITKDGVGIEFENTELGSLVAMVGITIKPIEYDLTSEVEEYNAKLELKAKAEQEKAETKAKKLAEKKKA